VENAFNSFDDFFVVWQIAAIRFGKALFDCVIEPRVVFGDAIECFFFRRRALFHWRIHHNAMRVPLRSMPRVFSGLSCAKLTVYHAHS